MKNKKTNRLGSVTLLSASVLSSIMMFGCGGSEKEDRTLPILGKREVLEREVEGRKVADTLYAQIPDFAFVNQDSQQVTSNTFTGKIYVSDFFFTSCPTICPIMKAQMLRVYEQYRENPQVMLLSHTIDPKHDKVSVLHKYAAKSGISSDKWHFVTGEKDRIYAIANNYFVSEVKDDSEAGGMIHSGAFVLVDEKRRVRGIYDGTDQAQVDKLLQDIPVLLNEQKSM